MLKTAIFVPIRLNSKRVKNKNIKLLGGRPLFCWSLEKLDTIDTPIFIYTNGEEILSNLLDFKPKNITFLKRPEHLDGDLTLGIDIYRQFSQDIPAEKYLLVHCTSPFVKKETYLYALEMLNLYQSVFSVEKIQTFTWYNNSMLNFSLPRPRTQTLEPIFIETSAFYGYWSNVLDKGDRSNEDNFKVITKFPENIDIDDESQFNLANDIAKTMLNQKK